MERHRWRAAPALAAACVQMARLLQGSERQSHAAGAAGKQRMQCKILMGNTGSGAAEGI